MTEEEYKNNWTTRGYSFATGVITTDRGVDKASHKDQDELVVVVNGTLEFTLDERSFVADNDSEVYIPARSVHSIKNIGAEDSVIYYGHKPV